MTEMTLERIAELETGWSDRGAWEPMGEDEQRQVLALARRALEFESRPQSQGVPTVTREHREAVLGECYKASTATERRWAATGESPETPDAGVIRVARLAQLLATREAAAYERGRSQATCSGEWLSGSGGHRVFGGCGKPASWVEVDGGAAACDEHLGQHVSQAAGDADEANAWLRERIPVLERMAAANSGIRCEVWADSELTPLLRIARAHLGMPPPAPPSDSVKGE